MGQTRKSKRDRARILSMQLSRTMSSISSTHPLIAVVKLLLIAPRLSPFISKHKIEHHLVEKAKGSEMTWTILRPVAFLENFTPDFFGKVFATCWKKTVKEKPLQLISVGDIGFFGAQAFMYPNQYQNRGVSLAGDELTYGEMAKIFQNKTRKSIPTTFGFVAKALMAMMKDLGYMFQWFYDVGYGANIPELRKVHPELRDFRTWLEKDSGFDTK